MSVEPNFKVERPDIAWSDAREACLSAANDLCEANTPACAVGSHRAVTAHHKRLRKQGGTHEQSNLVAVCAAAHDFVHRNTGWSYENGLLIRTEAA